MAMGSNAGAWNSTEKSERGNCNQRSQAGRSAGDAGMSLTTDELEWWCERLADRVGKCEEMLERLRKANVVAHDLSLDFWKILTPDADPKDDLIAQPINEVAP